MSPRDMPGVPRGRLRSHADDEPIPERVYQVLQGFDERIEGIESGQNELKADSQENKRQNASILTEVRNLAATDRHATTKLIAALVATVITTIGGVIGTVAAMRPGATPPAPARSALDVKLDVCRPLHDPGSRAECFARVFDESPK